MYERNKQNRFDIDLLFSFFSFFSRNGSVNFSSVFSISSSSVRNNCFQYGNKVEREREGEGEKGEGEKEEEKEKDFACF